MRVLILVVLTCVFVMATNHCAFAIDQIALTTVAPRPKRRSSVSRTGGEVTPNRRRLFGCLTFNTNGKPTTLTDDKCELGTTFVVSAGQRVAIQSDGDGPRKITHSWGFEDGSLLDVGKGGSLIVSQIKFENDDGKTWEKAVSGRAVRVDGGDLIATGCTFKHMNACGKYCTNANGGAVHLEPGSNFTATDCIFEGNQGGNGGAISSTGSTIRLVVCSFLKNIAHLFASVSTVAIAFFFFAR